MTTSRSWEDLVQVRTPVRIAVFVNHNASSTEQFDHGKIQDRALKELQSCDVSDSRVLVWVRYPKLTTLVFDLFHDTYDFCTAHIPNDLPVIIVRMFRDKVKVALASEDDGQKINREVAEYHNLNGFSEPPFMEDHYDGKVPEYPNP